MRAIKCSHCGQFASELTNTDDGKVCATCLENSYKKCSGCEEYFGNTAEIDGKIYCIDCAHDADYYQCDDCKEWSDELLNCGSHSYCNDCYEDHGYHTCHYCSEVLGERDLSYSDLSDNWFCNDCYNDIYTTCEGCGDEIYQANANDGLCSDCDRHHNEWKPQQNTPKTGRYDKVGSERCFGVEIETSSCDDAEEFNINQAWGCKEDGSVEGMEFYSSILCGNEGLEDIDNICNCAKRNRWHVDETCGLHVHLDMRGETDTTLFSISAAFCLLQDVFQGLVESDRVENSYCKPLSWAIEDLLAYKRTGVFCSFIARYYRYYWFNIMSYNSHQTFEIRLHQGTLNATEIKNWVKICLILADWASNRTLKSILDALQGLSVEEKFAKCCKIWESKGHSNLVEYYSEKVRGYGAFSPMELVTA